jgi:hypothetical protein
MGKSSTGPRLSISDDEAAVLPLSISKHNPNCRDLDQEILDGRNPSLRLLLHQPATGAGYANLRDVGWGGKSHASESSDYIS